ncbi:MAG: AAA family ATPase, partial [Rhodospirillales bacterium]|nr:AAA family ATPase [Rhodospirillales bacterium]
MTSATPVVPGSGFASCPACGTENPPRARFCGECGTRLATRGETAAIPAERKFVTILFADIRDSTRMIQNLDPEDAAEKLRPAIEVMTAAVREAGGIVNRIQGDGVMALFGAPMAVDDHALRACRAALLMRNRIAELPDADLAVRIGLHSGDVVTHVRPGDIAHSYDVTGPAAHFAARLEQAAESNTVLISGDTWALVQGSVEARRRDGLVFKGFDQPVAAWELTGLGQRSRWMARQAAGLSPFVGREAVMGYLRGRLNRARNGSAQFLAIGGEPGTGKSRVAHELVGGEAGGAWTVWEADGETTSSRAPFAIIRALLRRWLAVEETAAYEDVGAALTARLAALDPPAGSDSALAALLNLQRDDPAWSEIDLPARRRLIEAAVVAIIDAAQRERPLFLLIEDFHWADVESRAVLLALPDRLPDARLAIVATHRPMDGVPARAPHTLPITLSEFQVDTAGRFLDRLLGGHPSVRAMKEQLLDLTGRLPLFLEEAVRHLVESGALDGTPGAFVASGDRPRVETPRSVQAVAAARIDGLDAPLKALTQVAAAIGKRFPRALLADVGEADTAALPAAVRELAARHILFDSADGSGDFVEFRHEFIREAAYGAMVRDRRQGLHRRILDAIEARFADQLRDWTATLAHHAAEAQMWAKAVEYERKAAEGAIEASSYQAAQDFCQKALDHLERMPRTRDTISLGIDIRLMLRVALGATAKLDRWLRYTDEAIALATELDDAPRRLLANIHRTWALNFCGSGREAVATGATALNLAEALRIPASEALARFSLGQAAYAHGDFRRAVEVLTPAIEWLGANHPVERIGTTGTTHVLCLMMRANALASMARFADADADLEAIKGVVARTKRLYDEVCLSYASGLIDVYRGDFATALPALRKAYEICRGESIDLFLPLVAGVFGTALIAAGKVADAEAVLSHARRSAEIVGH